MAKGIEVKDKKSALNRTSGKVIALKDFKITSEIMEKDLKKLLGMIRDNIEDARTDDSKKRTLKITMTFDPNGKKRDQAEFNYTMTLGLAPFVGDFSLIQFGDTLFDKNKKA